MKCQKKLCTDFGVTIVFVGNLRMTLCEKHRRELDKVVMSFPEWVEYRDKVDELDILREALHGAAADVLATRQALNRCNCAFKKLADKINNWIAKNYNPL